MTDLTKISQQDAGKLIGRTPRWFQDKDGLPRKKADSGRWEYDGPKLVQWFFDREIGKLESGDAEKCKQLERWRGIRADLSELELSERKNKLLPVDQVSAMFRVYVSVFREANKQISRDFPQAGDTLNQALTSAIEQFEKDTK